MKKFFPLLLLAMSVPFYGFSQGCSARAEVAPYAIYCTSPNGSCRVLTAFGSGETTECISGYKTATCNKYDQYGGLIVCKHEYCIIL